MSPRIQTELAQLLEEQEAQNLRFTTAINNISQGLCFFDGEQRLIVCNDLYAEMYKLTGDLVRPGTTLREIVDHRYAAGACPKMDREQYMEWRTSISAVPHPSDTIVEFQDGRTISIHHRPMPDGGWVATHEDITARRRQEEDLRRATEQLELLALQDPLTGLANRRKFAERFDYDAVRAKRGHTLLSLLMVDIDHFKAINDRNGHPAGDECLRTLANILESSVRQVDLVARFGGEEFAILLPETLLADAQSTAERIRLRIAQTPCRLAESVVSMTVSVGAACMDPGGSTLDELVARADRALYRAKQAGRDQVCV